MNVLSDKVGLVTGGSKGIGLGVAKSMLMENMKVGITARTQSSLDVALEELSKVGRGEILGIVSDVRDFQSQQATVDQLLKRWGALDVLVANAGLGHFASIENLSSEQWAETIDINLTGVFNSVKVCIPALKKSKGYILTVASLAGINFFANGSAYNASKFGLVGFSQAIMLDLRDYGIKVSTIMPGSVATHFNNHEPNSADSWKIQPEDIGEIIVDVLKLNPRTLPSKIEVRPSMPPSK